MEKTIRLGVVGMGAQGSRYTRFAEANPHIGLRVVAFAEADPAARERKAAEHGLPAYATVEDLLDREAIDAVLVATPDFAHCAPVLAAAERGKHLLIEKPFATDLAEARRMVDAVERAGVVAQVCFQNRFLPAFTLARQAVAAGEIGEVLCVNGRLNSGGVLREVAEGRQWYNRTTVGWTQLPHLFDLARWITGKEPRRVYAVAVRKYLLRQGVTTDDVFHVAVTHTDDTSAIYEGAWCLPDQHPMGADFKLELIGDGGALEAGVSNQGVAITGAGGTRLPGLNQVSLLGDLRGAHLDLLASFARAARGDAAPLAPVADGLASTTLLVAIHRSIATGQAVDLSELD
jgi:predicted dehydrogenase